jgi:hypothetical protein
LLAGVGLFFWLFVLQWAKLELVLELLSRVQFSWRVVQEVMCRVRNLGEFDKLVYHLPL